MARNKGPESWSLKEGFGVFAPWTDAYKTMRGRNARTGVRFIMPFIIGFLVFMLMPLIQSLQFSLNDVTLAITAMPLPSLPSLRKICWMRPEKWSSTRLPHWY